VVIEADCGNNTCFSGARAYDTRGNIVRSNNGMAIDLSKPVRVFKNPKLGCYNIMQGGLIKATAQRIRLCDAEFLVRESGRQRMLRENRRTIHAYVQGRLVDYTHPDDTQTVAICQVAAPPITRTGSHLL